MAYQVAQHLRNNKQMKKNKESWRSMADQRFSVSLPL